MDSLGLNFSVSHEYLPMIALDNLAKLLVCLTWTSLTVWHLCFTLWSNSTVTASTIQGLLGRCSYSIRPHLIRSQVKSDLLWYSCAEAVKTFVLVISAGSLLSWIVAEAQIRGIILISKWWDSYLMSLSCDEAAVDQSEWKSVVCFHSVFYTACPASKSFLSAGEVSIKRKYCWIFVFNNAITML